MSNRVQDGKERRKQREAERRQESPEKKKEENWKVTAAIRRAVIMFMVWRKGKIEK